MAADFEEVNMLEILKFHARCNIKINDVMIDIIQKSDKKPYQPGFPK
jgi:hypothetical protein